MQSLTSVLEDIARETGDGPQAQVAAKGGDEFLRLKSKISGEVKQVRQKLKEREELLSKGAAGTKATVQISHMVRQLLKEVREDANKLMAIQRKEAGKTRGKEKAVEQAESRAEVVELVFKHIEECELQEKKRYTSKNSEARVELFSGGGKVTLGTVPSGRGGYTSCEGGGGSSGGAGPSSAGGTELPDIDADTQQGLQLLERKNEAIDQQLEVVAEGVQELKSIAVAMRDEVKVQGAMVDEITNKVDSAGQHLSGLNKKMKQTLKQTRSADRFILDFILLVILLAIIGYIITMVTDM